MFLFFPSQGGDLHGRIGKGGVWGGRLGEKKEGGGWEESRTVTFTRYDMATLTRCPPRRSAKLLSQSASISRSQPSAAPALLGRGLVPQTNPNVGRRCHCATLKRGLEISSTHTYRGPLIRPGNLPSNHLSCFAMLGLGHSLQRACLDKSELMGQNRKAKEDKGLANERLKEEEIKRFTLFPSNRP